MRVATLGALNGCGCAACQGRAVQGVGAITPTQRNALHMGLYVVAALAVFGTSLWAFRSVHGG